MVGFRRLTSAFLAGAILCTVAGTAGAEGTAGTNEPHRHVVGELEIQARIDAQVCQESADRKAIEDLLKRPEVRQLAESVGLDVGRASAAAAVLSGEELKDLAARARAADTQLGGGQVTLTYTAIIIVLLILIILLVA